MGNYPQKLKLPIATNSRSRQNVGGSHVTTANFMEFNVARAMELVPGQSLDIIHETFSRLEPLLVPTFGGAEIRNRAFWVPYRTVFPAFTDMITDVRHQFDSTAGTGNMQIVQHCPLISNAALYALMTSPNVSTLSSNTEAPDFEYYENSTAAPAKRVLTPFGRYVYKVLRSLGYAVVWTPSNTDTYTAMPLLCLMRVFVDWYYPSQYAESAQVAVMLSYLNSNKVPNSTSMFTGPQLLAIFQQMYKVSYDPSYLVSAWDNPNGPNTSTSSGYVIQDINNIGGKNQYSDAVVFNNGSTGVDAGAMKGPAILGQDQDFQGVNKISQYALTALKSLSDYLKRHQLAGSRALDRYLARFGYKLPAEKLNRSALIESYMQRIDFFDVTSTSSTDGASLGSFAGKGVSYGDGQFKVDSNGEYGMLIIISTIVPDEFHWQGIHRHVLHKSRLDFFTPEFDALGVQAISKAEAFVPMNNAKASSTMKEYGNSVFGYAPRYAEYKMGFSQITGDYALPSQEVSREAWTMGRDLSAIFESDTPASFGHDVNFVVAGDSTQYNRIFQYQGDEQDKFNIIHRFKIQSSFPGRSMYDDYEFRDEDKSKAITVDVNGSTVN